jgi:four helix bundle protein
MAVRSYRDLVVWQKAMDLAAECYRETQAFPAGERFGLTSQIRRAASSVPANIAEGRCRSGPRDFVRFLGIARGSVAELETQLILAERLGYTNASRLGSMLGRTAEIGRMIHGLRRAVVRRA